MLIRDAEVFGAGRVEVRLDSGRIADMGALRPRAGERVLDAGGGALLPGLHDHHLHLLSFAAAAASICCGPPSITSEDALIDLLRRNAGADKAGWLRGIGYHESVAGDIDRRWLDRHVPDRPTRIQHRSGRLWIVNSAGLAQIGRGRIGDGRLFDSDHTFRRLPGATPPCVRGACLELARYGVTGFSDMTPSNGAEVMELFAALQREGSLLQRVRVAGRLLPRTCTDKRTENVGMGPTKVHLHESGLPPFEALCELITASHGQRRPVAVHCVTEVELVFALAAFRHASPLPGDRIEHASVTPPALLDELADLDLIVVTQPNFVAERGAAYLNDVAASEHDWLYRARSFLDRGVRLAAGTDAPFGHADPWRAMSAAVTRRTQGGDVLGERERLTPEEALDLFLGPLEAPDRPRRVEVGAAADLCLLDCPWSRARGDLSSAHVRATFRGGRLIFDRVDQAPG